MMCPGRDPGDAARDFSIDGRGKRKKGHKLDAPMIVRSSAAGLKAAASGGPLRGFGP
jgi:hypothetical protein